MAQISEFDIQGAARRINEENRREDAAIAERRIAAQAEARRLAAALRERDPLILCIWCFGSTFDGSRPYRMDSDIDMAIEGGNLLKLLSTVEDSAFVVDLIDISGQADEFARLVRERGEPL